MWLGSGSLLPLTLTLILTLILTLTLTPHSSLLTPHSSLLTPRSSLLTLTFHPHPHPHPGLTLTLTSHLSPLTHTPPGAAEADKRRALERQRVELVRHMHMHMRMRMHMHMHTRTHMHMHMHTHTHMHMHMHMRAWTCTWMYTQVGSHSERAAMRQKLDKEERVELLRRQVLRRVMNASMTRGWSAWTELYEAKTYSLNKLRECGNKLHAPDVAGAFVEWLAVVEEEKANKAEELIKMEAKSLEVQLRHSRFEAGQLDILRVAHEDELRALKDKVGRLVATGKEQAATIDEHRGLADELAALHKLHTLKVWHMRLYSSAYAYPLACLHILKVHIPCISSCITSGAYPMHTLKVWSRRPAHPHPEPSPLALTLSLHP